MKYQKGAYNRVASYCTDIYTDSSKALCVKYHDTVIVKVMGNVILLNTDDNLTVTSKRKMNQASNQFGLGFSVYQEKFKWFVTLPNGNTVPYYDGITFER